MLPFIALRTGEMSNWLGRVITSERVGEKRRKQHAWAARGDLPDIYAVPGKLLSVCTRSALLGLQ